MKSITLAVAIVVVFASQALASPAPQATTPTIICPFTTPSTTGPPQEVLQCGDGFFCCQIQANAFCVPTTGPGSLGCPRIPVNPRSA